MKEETFKALWLRRFGFSKEDSIGEVLLPEDPLSQRTELRSCLSYLFNGLTQGINEKTSKSFTDAANTYGWLCLSVFQSPSAYPHELMRYTMRFKQALETGDLFSSEIVTLSRIVESEYEQGDCGLNRLILDDADMIRSAEGIVANGQYETFLTEAGKEKFNEYQRYLEKSNAFRDEWAFIKSMYGDVHKRWPELAKHGKIRRQLLPERNWLKSAQVSFDDDKASFFAVFNVFCWKWFLWAMSEDNPQIMKPSVNMTPYGTQIFIPGYMSLDAKRDLDLSTISKLHKARGVQRQSVIKHRVRELAKEAQASGLSVMDVIREKHPQIDERQIRRWLK